MLRRLSDEIALSMGTTALTVFWDVRKFYDSLSPWLLVQEAVRLEYPPLLLAIGMQVHAAPRIIRTSAGCLSNGVTPDVSILAGDGQSNSWARAFVHGLLQAAHDRFMPDIRFETFVDDLSQRGEDSDANRDLIAGGMCEASVFITDGLQALHLDVAQDKTVVVGTHADAADALKQALALANIRVKSAAHGRDLGIDAGTGRRRCTAIVRQRLLEVRKRMLKAKQMHKWSKGKASRLFTGSMFPAATYGVEATGMSYSVMQSLRASAAALSPHNGQGGCTTTIIAAGFKDGWDPAVRIRRQIVATWLDLWHTAAPKTRFEARITWERTRR